MKRNEGLSHGDRTVSGDLDQRFARYETLIEQSELPVDCRCTCNLCRYGVRPTLTLRPAA